MTETRAPVSPAVPQRLCPCCGSPETIIAAEAIWPVGHACPACAHVSRVTDGVPMFAPALADTISGFDPKSFERLAQIEDEHFWFVPRNRLLGTLLQRYFPNAASMLEIGCGNGAVLSSLAQGAGKRRLVGSELHPAGLVVARRRLGDKAEFVQMDARHIMAEQAFDVIGAFDVIEHIAEDEDVLRSMHRALTPSGGVIIAVPQHPWLWSHADDIAYHVRRYRRGELEAKLARNGFRPVYSGSYCALLLPLMVASRWLERMGPKSCTVETMTEVEMKPPAIVNRLLRALLELEVSASLGGLRSPVGGSRVVIAMRA